MTKRKRTYEQVEAMQEKAIRFQVALNHCEAAERLEEMTPDEYAALRKIEIIGTRTHMVTVQIRKWEEGNVKYRQIVRTTTPIKGGEE